MSERIPETNKKPGVYYAWTNDGVELPVIDLTHPAFASEIDEVALSLLVDNMQKASSLPPGALQMAAKNSILVRGMVESAGTFTSGMMTYLNKLNPDVLGQGYAGPLDRQWAASLTPVTFRWRMRDVVRLLADAIRAGLAARSSPNCAVHLINIAGGPAMDSINALILIQKEQPGLLAGREISIHVLDLDSDGPDFGARALQALQVEGAQLNGLRIAFHYLAYDWSDSTLLRTLLTRIVVDPVVVVGSTEGGLFEYASDAEIIENLRILYAGTPGDFRMVGPVVRDAQSCDPRLSHMDQVPGRPAIRFIGLAAFQKLAEAAGWKIERHLDGPMHQVVDLVKI